MVLLKNKDGLLPLDLEKIGTIGVIGPNADNRKALVGNYEGTSSQYITVLEGIRDYVGNSARIVYSEGCHLFKDRVQGLGQANDRIAEVKAVAAMSDVVIAVMGLDPGLEGEEGDQGNEFASGDKPNLKLPGLQEDVLRVLVESGKPVVLVLLSGSALAVPYADEHIPAILQGWYPGAQGGRAIANILFGAACPEGRLPVTFYRSDEDLPSFTDYAMKGRTYRYMTKEALYPFGYGLSYTEFSYSEAAVCGTVPDGAEVTVTVTNTGRVAGRETVQVYVKSPLKGAPNAQLKGLKKLLLNPGESKTVTIPIPGKSFGVYDEKAERVIVPGEYEIYVGGSAPDRRSAELLGRAPQKLSLRYDGGRAAYHDAEKKYL